MRWKLWKKNSRSECGSSCVPHGSHVKCNLFAPAWLWQLNTAGASRRAQDKYGDMSADGIRKNLGRRNSEEGQTSSWRRRAPMIRRNSAGTHLGGVEKEDTSNKHQCWVHSTFFLHLIQGFRGGWITLALIIYMPTSTFRVTISDVVVQERHTHGMFHQSPWIRAVMKSLPSATLTL